MTSRAGEAENTEGSDVLATGSDAFLRELADIGARPVAPDLPAGTRIDRFFVMGVIGRGGMGVVYDARDEELGRRVALKLLHPHHIGEADRRLRFAREAKAAAAVAHPNVARIFEVGDGESGAYLVLEKLEGTTLRAMLRSGPLPLRTLAGIGAQIARGLAAAHAAGVVHRDLKPENVIIADDGNAKILDFGLAKTAPSVPEPAAPHSDVLTVEGVVLGSPGYMSPEQALGKATSSSTDLFSLGVVLFELATGRRPFEGSTAMESIVATTRDQTPDPRDVRRELPRAFGRLVQRCLAKDSAQRPSAVDVEAALGALHESTPPSRRLTVALVVIALSVIGLAMIAIRARGPERAALEPVAVASKAPSGSLVTSTPTSGEPAPSREPPPASVSTAEARPRVEPRGSTKGPLVRSAPSAPVPPGSASAEAARAKGARPADDPSFTERK